MRDRLLQVGRVVFAVALIGLLALAAADNVDKLRHVNLQLQPGWALAAIPFTFLGGLALPLAWRHVLFAYGVVLDRATAVRVWCVSQASRYIPTGVAMVIGISRQRIGLPDKLKDRHHHQGANRHSAESGRPVSEPASDGLQSRFSNNPLGEPAALPHAHPRPRFRPLLSARIVHLWHDALDPARLRSTATGTTRPSAHS